MKSPRDTSNAQSADHKSRVQKPHAATPGAGQTDVASPLAQVALGQAQRAPSLLTPTSLLALQRISGNQAVLGLLGRSSVAARPAAEVQREPDQEQGDQEMESEETVAPRVEGMGFSAPDGGDAGDGETPTQRLGIQAKLMVGPAGDAYEQEADRVADTVMTASAPAADASVQRQDDEEMEDESIQALRRLPISSIQRQEEDEEESVQALQRHGDDESVQRSVPGIQRASLLDGFEADSGFESTLSGRKGGGSPLPDDVRGYMEPRFGVDFGDVRVHTGSESSQLNRQIGALAFTQGTDVYLGDQAQAPGTTEGNRVLAHELTHVVQQSGGTLQPLRRHEVRRTPNREIRRSMRHDAARGVVNVAPAASPPCIQRHSAFEHYLLGQVAPDELANLPFMREQKEAAGRDINELRVKIFQEKQKKGGDPAPYMQQLQETMGLQAKRNDAKHTLQQEMKRLLAFKDNPEAIPIMKGDDPTEVGEVKKRDDDTWQIPYVEIPVRDGEKVVIAYSEINTLPDLFGNPEAMAHTPKDKVLALLQGVRLQTYVKLDRMFQEIFGESNSDLLAENWSNFEGATGPTGQGVWDFEYEKRTEMQVNSATKRKGEESEQYFAALERNACHFAPVSWDSWQEYHLKAISKAEEAWDLKEQARTEKDDNKKADFEKQGQEASNQALLLNGFGEHYLQDSFAAGHLINKTDIMRWFTEYLNTQAGGVAKSLGSFENARSEYAMASTMSDQKGIGKVSPQALDDAIVRGEITTVEEAVEMAGIEVKPEIIFMMWWRDAAFNNDKRKHLSPTEAARRCPFAPARGNSKKAEELMLKLVERGFAKEKSSGVIKKTYFYSLNEGQIDVLRNKGAYKAKVAQDQMKNESDEEPLDFEKQANEFMLASYNAFLSNAYIQSATKFFHDRYCRSGLHVITGDGTDLGTIYGDDNMLNAGANVGVQYSAETSKWSREAVFNILNGEDEEHDTAAIRLRFPIKAIEANSKSAPISLVKWNESLRKAGNDGAFKEAEALGSKIAYKAMYGISGRNAINVEKVQQTDIKQQNEEREEAMWDMLEQELAFLKEPENANTF